MVIKVGINGFGRIGRVIFRTCLQNPDIELSAINDPAIDIDYICYLIKFDSTHGKFKGNVTHTGDQINIDDRRIKVFRDKLPNIVPWQVAGVQYVIEASGMFTSLEKSSGHLASECVKRVIVTSPSADVPMIILGVNDNKLNAEQKVLSCASSTLYCLAPIVKVLEENYGVSEGFITSIHAMTPSLKPLDGLCLRGKHWRDHRSILQNIIPASTGSCNALAKIIPQVKDKMTGLAFRVPIANVSVLDMTVRLNTNTSLQNILQKVEKASKSFLQNIINISNEEAVSSDFSGNSHSCIVDAACSLQLKPNFYKLICWYENEYSYACRVLDSIFFSERQFNKPVIAPCKMTYVRAKHRKKQDAEQQDCNIDEILSTNCNIDIPKISILQEPMFPLKRKPFVRQLVLRKPLSANSSGAATTQLTLSRDSRDRHELYKIWNNNNDAQKNSARESLGGGSLFFKSCMSFVPKVPENTDYSKAQERLEDVKRECSKMLNFTENLPKKSNSNKLQLRAARINLLSEVKLSGNEALRDTNVKLIEQPAKDPSLDVCGDHKNRVATECSSEEVRCGSSSKRNKNYPDFNIENTIIKSDSIKKISLVSPPQDELNCIPNQKLLWNLSRNSKGQNTFPDKTSELSTKTVKNLSKESLILVSECSMKQHKQMTPNVDIMNVEKKAVPFTDDSKASYLPAEKKVHNNQQPDSPEKINKRDLNQYLHKKDHNMHVIDEELQKHNFVLVNNQGHNSTEMNCKSTNTINEQSVEENNKRRKSLNKHILQYINRNVPGPVVIVPDESAECSPSETDAVANNKNATKSKSDLYDKLDSVSATDSNNSFEITERKSQVIHITDLTNSLDDLVRLDKICRIIEISDELSDKLFSSLKQSELRVKQKNWSFRDLCERIQLDDFCNKVFGHSRS